MSTVRVSVIIPVLNEVTGIADCITSVRQAGADQIIVVDGGSTDDTLNQASAADQVLRAERSGRAFQQNLGAAGADGVIPVFTCRLPSEVQAISEIREAFTTTPNLAAGCFRQHDDDDSWAYRILEFGNAARVRLLKWAYGDQGIFVRRELFEQVGGFPPLALMEDLYLMKSLEAPEAPFCCSTVLCVSARRWRRPRVFWLRLCASLDIRRRRPLTAESPPTPRPTLPPRPRHSHAVAVIESTDLSPSVHSGAMGMGCVLPDATCASFCCRGITSSWAFRFPGRWKRREPG
ncbi:MAG: glycosyltransferase family 2 protein [Planctomycetaceae bacterium]